MMIMYSPARFFTRVEIGDIWFSFGILFAVKYDGMSEAE